MDTPANRPVFRIFMAAGVGGLALALAYVLLSMLLRFVRHPRQARALSSMWNGGEDAGHEWHE